MAAERNKNEFRLVGLLGQTDSFGRIRLLFLDEYDTPGYERDKSWMSLLRAKRAAELSTDDHVRTTVPFDLSIDLPIDLSSDLPINDNDAGIRGECWITIAKRGDAKKRLLGLVEELRNVEVSMYVKLRRFAAFISKARHNRGEEIPGGYRLVFDCGLCRLTPRGEN